MKKIAIIYGKSDTEVQKRAIEELSEILLDYTHEYPACIKCGEDISVDGFRCIYIGTAENNSYIRSVSEGKASLPESYHISVKNDTVVIEGYDDGGVLYGVLDFYNRYIVKFEHPDTDKYWINCFDRDTLREFEYSSAPSVRERGLWTWGHVIYDYRNYLHNMMKLKMNAVIIWNDFVPTNAREIVEYAHSCNIKVYWGYAWLWDTKRVEIKNLEGEPERIFEKYEREYAQTGADGIYFQTFTEEESDNIDGITIAEAAANFVNETASLFYQKYPKLEIQFGLHATSVKNKLSYISKVDPRIRIVWENCGSFPFSYVPTNVKTFDETVEFVEKIAMLRGDSDSFGVVTKGLVKLDWSEFEHLPGSQCIGVSSERMKKNRIERKSRIWRYIQAGWIINTDKVQEMLSRTCRIKNGDLSMFALVEDGMFEENIMYPVALYSEMLWDCECDIKDLMKNVALRHYVSFA